MNTLVLLSPPPPLPLKPPTLFPISSPHPISTLSFSLSKPYPTLLTLSRRPDFKVFADDDDGDGDFSFDDYGMDDDEAVAVDNKMDYDVEYEPLIGSSSVVEGGDDIQMVYSKSFLSTKGWDSEMVVDYKINEDEFHKICLMDCDFFIRKAPDSDDDVYDFREDPMTTNMKNPSMIGPTGYEFPFFVVVSGTAPLFLMFFSNLSTFLSARRLEMYVTPPDTDIYAIPRVLAPMPQKYIRCAISDYGCYNVTEPPIDAPRDPMYKSEREILKVFLTKHYRNRRLGDPDFVLDFEEIYVIDSKTKSITRGKVLVTVPEGRDRDRKDDLLVVRDNGNSFKIIPRSEREDPTTVIEKEEWAKSREDMERHLSKLRDFNVSNWF
ncbi:hypothetical protein LguiB_017730 [Lonicera macranthoides]